MELSTKQKMIVELTSKSICSYLIGCAITMLDVDSTKGYITRVRPIKDLSYPTCNDDFVSRIIPLLELAIHGKILIDKTLKKFRNTKMELGERTKQTLILPPPFIPLRNDNKKLPTSLSTKLGTPAITHKISNNYQETPIIPSTKNSVVKQFDNNKTTTKWRTKINYSLLFLVNIVYYTLLICLVSTFVLFLYVIYTSYQRAVSSELFRRGFEYAIKRALVSYS